MQNQSVEPPLNGLIIHNFCRDTTTVSTIFIPHEEKQG